MKPRAFTRRLLQISALLTLIAVIIQGCDPIEDFIDELKKKKPEPTKIIGTAGGEIDFNGIILSFPEGTFTEDNEITVNLLDETLEFGEYAASALYNVDGLPESINQPIRIKIKYTKSLEGDPLIAVGERKHAVSLDSTLFSYHSESALDSAGYLVYSLPVYSNPAKTFQQKSAKSEKAMNFLVLNTYKRVPSSGGHFMLSYPLQFEQKGVLMGKYFEAAYDTCQAMGFTDAGRTWPANVLARILSKEDENTSGWYSYYTPGGALMNDLLIRGYINSGEFTINLNILSDDLELRATCGHEYLHLIQHLYEFSSPDIEPEQAWLQEATAVWIEEKYANIPNYYSSSLHGREYYPFYGWQNDVLVFESDTSHSKHGYGMALLVKDIADVYGDAAIVHIHEKIRAGTLPDGAVDPVDAVLSVINEPVGNFWHGVLGSYLLGHYYNGQASTRILNNLKNRFGGFMISQDYPSHTFKSKYHDLSGELFWVSAGNLGSNAFPLSFSVDDPANCGILVCKYKAGGEIAPLGEVFPGENGQVIINDVKPVFDSGYELVVMVSNSSHDKSSNYQAEKDIKLTIGRVSGITSGEVEFFLDHVVFQRSDVADPFTHELSEVLYLRDLTGSSSNSVYNGSYQYESLGRLFKGNIRITFLDNPTRLNLHLDHNMSYHSIFGLGDVKFHYVVDYNDLPYETFDATSGMHVYSESGSKVSKMNISWSQKNDQYTTELKSFTCSAPSFIRVEVNSK